VVARGAASGATAAAEVSVVEDIARSVEGACWRDDLRKFFEPRYLYTPQFLANPACKKRVKKDFLF